MSLILEEVVANPNIMKIWELIENILDNFYILKAYKFKYIKTCGLWLTQILHVFLKYAEEVWRRQTRNVQEIYKDLTQHVKLIIPKFT